MVNVDPARYWVPFPAAAVFQPEKTEPAGGFLTKLPVLPRTVTVAG